MTIDETPRGQGPGGETTGHAHSAIRRARPRALRGPVRPPHAGHEVLRDARPDGGHRAARGHLARRRPAGHDDLPGGGLRRADGAPRRRGHAARAPVRPDRGPRRGQGPDPAGDGGRGHGGRARRPARDHRRPAGDRPRLQDADRPGRRGHRRGAHLPRRRAGLRLLPGRRRADRDGRARHADRRARGGARAARRRGPQAEVHLHDPVLPEPGRRDDVARAPPPAGRDRPPPRAARARGQPVRDAPLRGRAAADAVLARRRRVRDLPRHVLEDPLARPAAGLDRRPAPRARQAQPRQGRRRPVLLAALAAVRAPVLRRARLARPTCASRSASTGGGATSCSRRWPSTSRARRRGPARRAACSSGPGCRTTSTRPTCSPARCASTSRSCPAARRTWTAAAARRCG